MSFGGLTVTVVNIEAGAEDRYGRKARTSSGSYALAGCHLQQRDSEEERVEAGTTVTEWVLFAPDPTPDVIRARDQVRIDAVAAHVRPDAGQTYATFELEGEPDFLDNFDGSVHHLELILRRAQL